jgi:hypothetical protein
LADPASLIFGGVSAICFLIKAGLEKFPALIFEPGFFSYEDIELKKCKLF